MVGQSSMRRRAAEMWRRRGGDPVGLEVVVPRRESATIGPRWFASRKARAMSHAVGPVPSNKTASSGSTSSASSAQGSRAYSRLWTTAGSSAEGSFGGKFPIASTTSSAEQLPPVGKSELDAAVVWYGVDDLARNAGERQL